MNYFKFLFILTEVCCFFVKGYAQYQYADMHTHLTLKHYYRDIDDPQSILADTSNMQLLKVAIGNINWVPVGSTSRGRKKAKESNFANYFQTNFSELDSVRGSILCNSFYPWEKIRTIGRGDRLIDHLLVSRLRLRRLKSIAHDDNSPFKEFMGEYFFAVVQSESKGGNTIKFVKNAEELSDNINKGITSSVMTIEGGQVLSGPLTGSKKEIRGFKVSDSMKSEILKNVNTLKNLPHRLFFITPSHFSWNRISSFAKTLDKPGFRRWAISKLAGSQSFREHAFLNFGQGIYGPVDCINVTVISDSCKNKNGGPLEIIIRNCRDTLTIGEKVICEFLNPATSLHKKATFIDVKHMDVLARLQYYKLRDSLQKAYNIRIPIIASHIAVSGEDVDLAMATGLYPFPDQYKEIKDPLQYYTDLENKYSCTLKEIFGHEIFHNNIDSNVAGWFYPWSINLFNEEIKIIHNSDGMMGLMLDGRQLGQNMPNYSRNHYRDRTKESFDMLLAQNSTYIYRDFNEYFELEPFIRNMVFLAMHCGDSVCWNHISLGSDFDGLIHPLKICPTVNEIPLFKRKLIDYFDIYLAIHQQSNLKGQYSSADIIHKLFYSNLQGFISEYF